MQSSSINTTAPITAPFGTVRLLGLEFCDADIAAVAAWIAGRSDNAPFGYVVTPNADHVVRIARDPALSALYQQALLRLMDSRVVSRAAGLIGLARPVLVPGSDLTAELMTKHLRPGDRVTVVGLWPKDLPLLLRRFEGVRFSHWFPPLDFERDPVLFQRVVDFVIANPARLIILACGMPRQEMLAHALLQSGQVRGTALCVGSALEFLIGAQRRAPVWMRHAGVEWLHRLCREPRRLARRYLIQSPPVFAMLLRARLQAARR